MRRYQAEQEGEEYHFTDDESFEETNDEDLEIDDSPMDKLKQFILPALVGVLFIGYAGYKLIGLFYTSTGPIEQQNLLAATEFQAAAPAKTPSETVAPAPGLGQLVTAPEVPSITPIEGAQIVKREPTLSEHDLENFLGEYKGELSKLQKQMRDHVDRRVTVIAKQGLKQEASLAGIVKALGNLGQSMTELNKNILDSSQKIQNQAALSERVIHSLQRTEQQLQHATPAAIPAHFPQRATAASQGTPRRAKTIPPRYFIQAIIPGRAWLKAQDGHVVTVVRGNHIPGYGRVLRVDSDGGSVVTSSGRVIRYGIEQG